MEGYLEKKEERLFGGWTKYYFILHQEMLYQLDKKDGKLMGQIHMQVAKVQNDKDDKLVIRVFNGTNEIALRASSIKEMVEWSNALHTAQKLVNEGRYEHLKKKPRKDSFNGL
jgi:oxysterol-binding protein-related protein 3/6/7